MTVVSGACLAVAGVFLITIGTEASRRGLRGARAWAIFAGIGALYLAVDEIMTIHETLGERLTDAIPALASVVEPDVIIFAAYAIAAACIGWKLLPLVFGWPSGICFLVACVVFFGASTLLDWVPWKGLSESQRDVFWPAEEILKTLGSYMALLYARILLLSILAPSERSRGASTVT
jgi:hypothetical protein